VTWNPGELTWRRLDLLWSLAGEFHLPSNCFTVWPLEDTEQLTIHVTPDPQAMTLLGFASTGWAKSGSSSSHRVTLLPKGHLVMSGDALVSHNGVGCP
jgi:hypothetical protein